MSDTAQRAASTKAPDTRREDVREIMHGVEVSDPYRWLEDGNSAETRAWTAAQQEYTASFLNTPARRVIRRSSQWRV